MAACRAEANARAPRLAPRLAPLSQLVAAPATAYMRICVHAPSLQPRKRRAQPATLRTQPATLCVPSLQPYMYDPPRYVLLLSQLVLAAIQAHPYP